MQNSIEYKGFIAQYDFNEEDACYVAKVINSTDTIITQGRSPEAIKCSFEQCIDVYLATCKNNGVIPNQYNSPWKLIS
ncbi:MAG: hypothetical protein LEGION0398_MBIBDBAK_00154 [Legionellaceae bacterium]